MHAAHDGGRHRLCVDWAGGDACVRVFASGARFLEGPGKEMLGKGTKEGTCSLSDAGGNVQGRGGNMFANVSACSQMCQRALTQKRTLGRPLEQSAAIDLFCADLRDVLNEFKLGEEGGHVVHAPDPGVCDWHYLHSLRPARAWGVAEVSVTAHRR